MLQPGHPVVRWPSVAECDLVTRDPSAPSVVNFVGK